MGRPSPGYTPKAAAQGVLHQVVRDHFETFRAEAARVYERDALPRFIEEEFRGFLRCGFLQRRARQAGVRGGRGGAVAIIQRFGSTRDPLKRLIRQLLGTPKIQLLGAPKIQIGITMDSLHLLAVYV
jgi:hypothetical protein